MRYLIWSGKRGAWWRANRCGYTDDINEAGVYSGEEAAEIVADTAFAPMPQRNVIVAESSNENLTTIMRDIAA